MDQISDFALSSGMVLGGIRNPEVVKYLKERGVTNEDIEMAYQALIKIANAFYKDIDNGQI